MPRTKQVRKTSAACEPKVETRSTLMDIVNEEYKNDEDFLNSVNNYCAGLIQTQEMAYKEVCNEVKKTFSNCLQGLPDPIKLSNLSENVQELTTLSDLQKYFPEDQNQDPNLVAVPRTTTRASRSRKPSETFEFKVPREPRRTSSRSSSRKRLPTPQPPPPNTGFKTPSMSTRKLLSGATITPKFSNDRPITMMRRPIPGEMALSLDGSPLMVGATSREDIPTVNVPMEGGKIFSIMPEEGEAPLDMPQFDEVTRQYLKTLRKHLQILAPNSP